ncbi:MAG: hypothetical protein IMY79_02980 [Chloroflexi bacterium]|nr:hypothetical protein [Chloroflexota bacterium]
MAKLSIERDPTTILRVELDDSLCERLWNFEKEWWRGKRESGIQSWDSLIPAIFDTFLESKGY